MNASVIEAKQSCPNKGKDGEFTQDPEADWNVKAGSDGKRKSTYGYTAGNVHDPNCFTDLLDGDESAVYVDSAYGSKDYDAWLKQNKIENRIIRLP